MAKVILEFDSIEERSDIEQCLYGNRLISDRDDFRQFLRSIEKTGTIRIDGELITLSEEQYKIFDAIRDEFYDAFEHSATIFE